jgi:hypothetical protein
MLGFAGVDPMATHRGCSVWPPADPCAEAVGGALQRMHAGRSAVIQPVLKSHA